MIAFSGLDGAGKSTQIGYLRDFYNQKKIRTIVLWSRGGYTPGMELVKSLLRRFKIANVPLNKGESPNRDVAFSKRYIRKIWLNLAMLDLLFYYAVYIRVLEFVGIVVICDRYLYDTLLDFKRNFPQENIQISPLWRFLMLVATKPEKHFVLTISVQESQLRSKLKHEPFPDSYETLEFRLAEYLKYCSTNREVVQIDCEKRMDLIQREILANLVK